MGGLSLGEKRNPKDSSSVGGDGAGDLAMKWAIPTGVAVATRNVEGPPARGLPDGGGAASEGGGAAS
jgi:hypothetical protein